MKTRLYLIGETFFLQKANGELARMTRSAARHFLLNFSDPEYSQIPDAVEVEAEEQDGDIIAEVVEGGFLLVKNAVLFKGLAENDGVTWVSVNEFADLHAKSPAMVRRHCQNKRIEGAIHTPGGYIIPQDAPYPK